MTKLTELVIEYKKTKSEKVFEEIYKILYSKIKKKAEFIYYSRKFGEVKLCDIHFCEYDDVIGELNLDLIKTINNYDSKLGDFNAYWFRTWWNWKPSFINKDFFNQLKNVREYKLVDDKEENIINAIAVCPPEEIDLDELFNNLTNTEKEVIRLLIEFRNVNQSEIAKSIGVTQSTISRILNVIRKKYKTSA